MPQTNYVTFHMIDVHPPILVTNIASLQKQNIGIELKLSIQFLYKNNQENIELKYKFRPDNQRNN